MQKRYILIALFSLLFNSVAFSQTDSTSNSVSEIEAKLEQLKDTKNNLTDKLSIINNRIDSLDEIIYNKRFQRSHRKQTILVIDLNTKLHKSDLNYSDVIVPLTKDEKVIFKGLGKGNFIKVRYKDKVGYISKYDVKQDKEFENIYSAYTFKEKRRKLLVDSLINNVEKNKQWVKSYRANFRTKPTTNSNIFRQLEKGDVVFVQKEEHNWLKVKYLPDKVQKDEINKTNIDSVFQTGWIYSSLLSNNYVGPIAS